MAYTETKYVDANIGVDSTSSGSFIQPYKTIEYCISRLTTTNPLIYIGDGVYQVIRLSNMSSKNKTLTFIGNSDRTIIEALSASGSTSEQQDWKGESNIYNCIIRRSNHRSDQSTQYLSSTKDKFDVKFYNVTFTRSLDGSQPASEFFPLDYYNAYNKYWYNCVFTSKTWPIYPNESKKKAGTFYSCAFETDKTGGTVNNAQYNCKFDTSYFILDSSNNIDPIANKARGVYSGENAWIGFLLKSKDGNYYSVLNQFYDINSKSYIPLNSLDFTYKFNAQSLFNNITINGETFRPIDKFEEFSIVLSVVKANSLLKVMGIKSNSELIAQSFDINVSLFEKINSIILNDNVENSLIKIVFSSDRGETWKTIDDLGNLLETDCIIPKKNYEGMTDIEKLQHIASRETIKKIGFTLDKLSSFDFNTIKINKIRFAYVLSTDSYINNPYLDSLKINHNEKKYMQQLKDTECDIEVFDHTVKIKSNIANPLIETNIII